MRKNKDKWILFGCMAIVAMIFLACNQEAGESGSGNDNTANDAANKANADAILANVGKSVSTGTLGGGGGNAGV
jgi:hypothetical protein